MFEINIESKGADGKPVSFRFNQILKISGNGIEKLDLAAKFASQHKSEEKEEHKNQTKHNAEPKHDSNSKIEKHDVEKDKDASDHEGESSDEKEETNWVFIISSIVIGNLLLAGTFAGGYIFMKRRKEKSAEKLGEEMDGGDSKEEPEKAEEPEKEDKAKDD